MTRVKICGITSIEDAHNVAAAGADAIGLVFYAKSSRYVTPEQAAKICNALPPFVTSVALFMNADAEQVNDTLNKVKLDLLQFHGAESAEFCRSFNKPYIKAVGINGLKNFTEYADQYHDALGILIDSHALGKAGGTGETFDWTLLPKGYAKPIILAGGLTPDNVAEAIMQTSVYAVDLSSGVESSSGIKSKVKINALMKEVNRIQA
ncbi:phosphoribosylanthranilate isomerase [Leucothrix arctica]|uniref:N-(5'-phosphoribosyl)anthranilate isomerase n=1 Tax=Leucothrix arctica TaxID=1481894 RepID=A0A317CH18_9GAMM|nr:phosphoribosylanthranilate isomerase [Leucothrix arctica]PWQ96693.1 phosphoribosylanthranilate isomerase [Leucothrix arctica]